MKWSGNICLLAISFWLLMGCNSDQHSVPEYRSAKEIQLIPQPNSILLKKLFFTIDDNTIIVANPKSVKETAYLKSLIEAKSTFKLDTFYHNYGPPFEGGNAIRLWIHTDTLKGEEFELNIQSGSLNIYAGSNEGLMRGIQTLRQLFIDEFHGEEKREKWYLPNLTIKDAPVFKHRGLLLDCSRHFFEKDVVKKYIDLLAFYKMNILHWHLTEDQGWRIAIDKYPKLIEIAAWRTELNGDRYGGFYSKEDIKEIVAYAQERHVTIIPEIELPGHSQAAISAYPHLSCTGEQVEVTNDWGVFKEIYCAGNDSVFLFLEDVLTEVMELFPSKYIHIGGDEAPKYRWENCKKCQQRIIDEGLKDEHELQSYFISRIEKFLNQHERQLIGWDEILEGGLSPNATVQSWRGMNGGIEAAESGHQAIMSPTSHCYLDYDLKAIDLEKVYHFDPIPEDLAEDKHHFIIGGEVNMWTEHVPNEANLDSKVFPRLMALSDVLWSYPEERNYEEFYNRVQYHYPALQNFGVDYGLENHPASLKVEVKDGKVLIDPKPGNKNLNLKYNWHFDADKSNKENVYRNVGKEISLDKSGTLYLQAYKNKQEYGASISQHFEVHQAIGEEVKYTSEYNQWYTAGGKYGLVDGKTGTTDFRDGNWQGYFGKDVELFVDLGKEKEITSISTNCYQYNNAWIFMPVSVQFQVSTNGNQFVSFQEIPCKIKPEQRDKNIETFTSTFDSIRVRYIKVKAKNIMKVPDWHEAAGSEAWIFMDEIIVK